MAIKQLRMRSIYSDFSGWMGFSCYTEPSFFQVNGVNAVDVKQIRNYFEEYTRGFTSADGVLPLPLRIKIRHCRQVAEDCGGIAGELGWDESEVAVATSLGCLHDIGRFQQYTRYKTFRDGDSVNHAQLGCEVLDQCRILESLAAGDRKAIRDGIFHHNRRELPPGIPEASLRYIRLVRDADKLDIFRVVYEAVTQGHLRDYPEITLDLDIDGPVSMDLLEDIRGGKIGGYHKLKSLMDVYLIQVSWVYDFNYRPSLARMKQREILEKLGCLLPSDPAVRDVVQSAARHLEWRLRSAGACPVT